MIVPNSEVSMSKKALIASAILIIIVLMNVIFVEVVEVVVVDKNERFGEVVYRTRRIEGLDTIDVHWIHSVSRRPILERYRINEDYTIDIEEMYFDAFSANLPNDPDADTIWEITDDYIRVYNYDITFDAIPVVIGAVRANHSMAYNGKEVFLKDVYKPGGFVNIRVRRISLIEAIFERR